MVVSAGKEEEPQGSAEVLMLVLLGHGGGGTVVVRGQLHRLDSRRFTRVGKYEVCVRSAVEHEPKEQALPSPHHTMGELLRMTTTNRAP